MLHLLGYILYAHTHLYLTRNRPHYIISVPCHGALYHFYAFSSLHYTVLGIILFNYPLISKHFQTFFPLFMCIQGPISYLSDVAYLEDVDHWSHWLDRTFASYNMFWALCVFCMCFEHNNFERAIIVSGILVKKLDDYCFRREYVKTFMILHILWHTILPAYGIYKTILKNRSPLPYSSALVEV